MLFDAAEPLHHPVLLQARLTALMSMLEAQNGAVERLRVAARVRWCRRQRRNGR
jgi:hypothetical protein